MSKIHLAIKTQDYSAALRFLRSHILSHPESYIAYELRALCALHCSDYPQALSDAVRCTTLNPQWTRGWIRLASAQLCMGHPQAALSAYEKAKTLLKNPKLGGCPESSRFHEEIDAGMLMAQKMLALKNSNTNGGVHSQIKHAAAPVATNSQRFAMHE